MTVFKEVSLFSGAGGFDWGFKEIGFEIVFANDVLKTPMRTHTRNFKLNLSFCSGNERHTATPGTALVCDVSYVDFSELREQHVDAAVGGPPCQDFSIIRGPEWNRKGIEVKRGRLYAHFVRAIAQIQPKVFVFENVPGLVSSNKGLAYRVILEDLAHLNLRWDEVKKSAGIINGTGNVQGYEIVFSDVVDFSKIGVPQKRKRLIIIGIRRDLVKKRRVLNDVRRAAAMKLKDNGVFAKFPLTAMEVFEGKVLPELQNEYMDIMKMWDGVWLEAGTSKAWDWKKNVWDKLTFNIVEDYLAANNVGKASEHELEEAWREHSRVLKELGYSGTRVCSKMVPDGTCRLPKNTLEVRERMRKIPPGENYEFVEGTKWGISIINRRLHPLKPSYTVVAHGGGRARGYHYRRDREALSLREKARLQTFPDSFLFCGTKAEIETQIGEAVSPLMAKRIAETVLSLLELVE